MAKVGSVNVITDAVKNAPGCIYNTVVGLLLAGWTIQSYGTGTTGSYVTSGAGWNLAAISTNTRAWVRVREPGARGREWIFQVFNGSPNWYQARIKYSANSKFTGGSPDAQTTPSAADERLVVGTGTDASPGAAVICPQNVAMRHHCVAFDSSVGNSYPWYSWAHNSGTSTLNHVMFQDALSSGSYDVSDVDPVAVYAGQGLSGTAAFWSGYGTGSPAVQTMAIPTSQLGADGARIDDPTSGKKNACRVEWYGTSLLKGFSYGVLLKAQGHAHPNTGNKASDCWAYLGGAAAGVLLPFLNGQDPLL